MQAALFAQQLIEIADNVDDMYLDQEGGIKPNAVAVAKARLQSDNRKWIAAKLLPKIYGERITADTTVHVKQESALDDLE